MSELLNIGDGVTIEWYTMDDDSPIYRFLYGNIIEIITKHDAVLQKNIVK